jgi:endoglucanase
MANQDGRNDGGTKNRRRLWKILAVIAVLALGFFMLSGSSAKGTYIRVNQAGYVSGRPMRAYLMAGGQLRAAKFGITSSDGHVVHSAAVPSRIGTWGGYSIYPLDFSLDAAGSYEIAVTGSEPANFSFRVDTGNQLYSAALHNALAFFQAQRDGADYVASDLRTAPGHLTDAKASVYNTPEFSEDGSIKGDLKATGAVIDASGGWWDAGDYLKFVDTASYVEALMLIGIRDFPDQMGAGSSTSNFMNEAKFGLDWLQRMWDDKSQTLYYQVGIGSGNSSFENDHSIWRRPEADDTYGGTDRRYRYIRNRPVFVAGPAGSRISPNLAGRLAADFALCFTFYRLQNPPYANQCLASAEHIFDLADTSAKGDLLTAAPHDFYGESEWRDDMELGATELYDAIAPQNLGPLPPGLPHTDPKFYLQAAAQWASAYMHAETGSGDSLNLYDLSGLAHFELFRAMELARSRDGLAVLHADLLSDIKKKLDQAVKQAGSDPFGFGFSWQEGDTAAHGAGLAVMASEYDYLTHSSRYSGYASQWLGNILGANAWGTSFIVGDGTTFPHCIHHQVANLAGSHDGRPPVLAGAAVEGPTRTSATDSLSHAVDWLVAKRPSLSSIKGMSPCPVDGSDTFAKFNGNGSKFKDVAWSYSTAEPAIDLTAPSFLMFAWQMAGEPTLSGHPR